MADIELIIKIPESDYQRIKEYYEKNDVVEATYSYIYHGTPFNEVLDKIRAEIDREGDYYDTNVDQDIAKGLYKAVQIIDRKISEVSE